jgi:hypothetical protein
MERDIFTSDISEQAPLNEMASSWTSTDGAVEDGPKNLWQVSPDAEEGPMSVQEPANIQGPAGIESSNEIAGGADESEAAPGSTNIVELRVKFLPFRLLL